MADEETKNEETGNKQAESEQTEDAEKVIACFYKGKPAFRWGENGFAYTYKPGNIISKNAAKRKAAEWAKGPRKN